MTQALRCLRVEICSLVIYPFVREPCKTDDMQAGILTPVTQIKHRSTQRLIMTWENNGAPDHRQVISFFLSFFHVSKSPE